MREQIAKARTRLHIEGGSERAVHKARKACKRARATLALMRTSIPDIERKELDRVIRDAARHIGPIRDADVLRQTWASMAEEQKSPEVPEPERDSRAASARDALDEAERMVEALDLSGLHLKTLTQGLLRSWQLAQKTWDEADLDEDPEALHEWRKAIKRLLYSVRLLMDLEPTVLGGLELQLDHLQTSLGEHHDLQMLAESEEVEPEVVQSLRDRSAALEAKCLALGGWILSAPPTELRRWLQLAEVS